MFVFGTAAADDVIDALDGILKSSIVRCVPLADITIPDSILDAMRGTGERFYDVSASAAMLGLA